MCNQVKLFVIYCHVFVNFNVSLPVFVLVSVVCVFVCLCVSIFCRQWSICFYEKGKTFLRFY